jgi:response regulator RpfG family c-di-GMP phosphodiesterase
MTSQNKPCVLYVDDTAVNLILFKETFKNDFDITLTEFPHDALKILEEKEIQVIVSDQRMPEMTGIELLEIVAEKYPDIRRYLLTAYTDAETVIEGVNVGRIHGFIKKPMKADEIRVMINNSMEIYLLRKKNKQIMAELENVNAALLNMDGLKSEIINSISNEISHPLNRIMGTLHLLKSKIEGDELTEVVNILDQSVFKLEQFSMLARQISVLKSPGFLLDKNRVSLNQLIQYSSIETSEELKESYISLKKDLDSTDHEVKGDSDLLVSCLVNIIRFAKEHTGNNGAIEITSSIKDGELECQVEDGGDHYSDTLFGILSDQFSRKDTPLNLTMGIGLAVSQMIMETHGGHLIFERTKRSKGKMKMVFPNE